MWLFDLFSSLFQLICQGMAISKCFCESLGIRDNESQLYCVTMCLTAQQQLPLYNIQSVPSQLKELLLRGSTAFWMDTHSKETTFKINFAFWKGVYAKVIESKFFKQGSGNIMPDVQLVPFLRNNLS